MRSLDCQTLTRWTDQPTVRPTVQPTNRWTDTTSYRGELAHLKIKTNRSPKVGDEQQLKISKAESASCFEKNLPPEVLRVIEGANHH